MSVENYDWLLLPRNLQARARNLPKCLPGFVANSWLGFTTVYRTIVDASNDLCISIKPQHGKLGFSIVSLEAIIQKTSVKWETGGRSTSVVYGPQKRIYILHGCNHCATFGYTDPTFHALPTHCSTHKLEGQQKLV